jgi:2-C-methyl-D-erythritol 4-phosphate cytidylyltransferase/2-C-methyl-D-erythritol 2,4-cyclodiphosphate synthase
MLLGRSPYRATGLQRVQTPQAFHFTALLAAHRTWQGDATDDAQIARAAGLDVVCVTGDKLWKN